MLDALHVKENPDQLLRELGDIADAEELKAVRRKVADNWRHWEQRLSLASVLTSVPLRAHGA